MTIDELARRAGTTTRNVRAYQTRGLIPAPALRGRVGYYDESHLARLRLIDRLQEQGFSLAGIEHLLDAWEEGRSLTDLLGFEEALTAPWSDEAEEHISLEDLATLYPGAGDDPERLRRAAELGILLPEGDGFRVPSPQLLRMGSDLVAGGVPAAAALDIVDRLRTQAAETARAFVELFERHVWEPFVAAGMPKERLPDVTRTLQSLRPMAAAAVQATLAHAMDREVAAATVREVGRAGEANVARARRATAKRAAAR
jgi:DNA-binding transcriptional MerR regulator